MLSTAQQQQIKWRFAELMVAKRLSNEQMAHLMGTSVTSISRYRKATMPQLSANTLLNMCQALGCQPGDLMVITGGQAFL